MSIGLVVGLGNPGKRYGETRHNVGFCVLDRVREEYGGGGSWQVKREGEQMVVTLCERDVILLKPMTMMNCSGIEVGRVCRYSGLETHEVLVVHDDIDIELGDVRIKEGGGSGGHNGLKSIDGTIGRGYRRLRCGVGRPDYGGEGVVAKHVLSRFGGEERECWEEGLEKIVNNFSLFMGDLEEAKRGWGEVRGF